MASLCSSESPRKERRITFSAITGVISELAGDVLESDAPKRRVGAGARAGLPPRIPTKSSSPVADPPIIKKRASSSKNDAPEFAKQARDSFSSDVGAVRMAARARKLFRGHVPDDDSGSSDSEGEASVAGRVRQAQAFQQGLKLGDVLARAAAQCGVSKSLALGSGETSQALSPRSREQFARGIRAAEVAALAEEEMRQQREPGALLDSHFQTPSAGSTPDLLSPLQSTLQSPSKNQPFGTPSLSPLGSPPPPRPVGSPSLSPCGLPPPPRRMVRRRGGA